MVTVVSTAQPGPTVQISGAVLLIIILLLSRNGNTTFTVKC